MRITRIDVEGRPGHYAILSRKGGSDYIDVQILTPDMPGGRVHHVEGRNSDDMWSMAECLQHHLDGGEPNETAIHRYFRTLAQLLV